jgi:signal transduction histidine kinase
MIVNVRGETSDLEALERLLLAEREQGVRALHDRVGPALCAAGLHLSLIQQSLPEGQETPEALDRLREALESATEQVRALVYLNEPRLVERCGLLPALSSLASACGAHVSTEAGAPGWDTPTLSAALRVLQSAASHFPSLLVLGATAQTIWLRAGSPPPPDLGASLQALAGLRGLTVACSTAPEGAEITISLASETSP